MFPKHELQLHGGCNCGAIRYTVSVPAWAERPSNPYHTPGVHVEGDLRIPMTVIDHCNDCRRAAGALLPVALVTDITWVAATCTLKSDDEQRRGWRADELFDFQQIDQLDVHLKCYKSSPKRSRWFCGRCGTHMAYTVDDGVVPAEWGWPKMLDIWLGSIDRDDLEPAYMSPERQLWCEKGIPWVRKLASHGGQGIPEHPTTKVDQMCNDTQTIEEVLEDARRYLTRVTPAQALAEVRNQTREEPVVLVDIRPEAQRIAEGMIQGALIVERNVLEWRFDPSCAARLPIADRYDLRIIVFCQESYTSSLAARALKNLGLSKATDMIGGYRDWKRGKLPESL